MITLTELQQEKIWESAITHHPHEMCGILTADDFIPCPNMSENPTKSFTLPAEILARYAGQIVAIVHSHCRDKNRPEVFDCRTPSPADMAAQKASGVPWLIVATEGEVCTPPVQIPREPSREYIGRNFIWYINDCYTLVQDYYRFELGILLPDHKATQDFRDLRTLSNLFDDYIEEYGFTDVMSLDQIEDGMLLLLDNGGAQRNHLGIVHQGQVIHQDFLSVSVPLEHFVGRIHRILKYVGTTV